MTLGENFDTTSRQVSMNDGRQSRVSHYAREGSVVDDGNFEKGLEH